MKTKGDGEKKGPGRKPLDVAKKRTKAVKTMLSTEEFEAFERAMENEGDRDRGALLHRILVKYLQEQEKQKKKR